MTRCALAFNVARVHVIALVVDVVCLMLVNSALVVVHAVALYSSLSDSSN